MSAKVATRLVCCHFRRCFLRTTDTPWAVLCQETFARMSSAFARILLIWYRYRTTKHSKGVLFFFKECVWIVGRPKLEIRCLEREDSDPLFRSDLFVSCLSLAISSWNSDHAAQSRRFEMICFSGFVVCCVGQHSKAWPTISYVGRRFHHSNQTFWGRYQEPKPTLIQLQRFQEVFECSARMRIRRSYAVFFVFEFELNILGVIWSCRHKLQRFFSESWWLKIIEIE